MLTLKEMTYLETAVADVLTRVSEYAEILEPKQVGIEKFEYHQNVYDDMGDAINSMGVTEISDTLALGTPITRRLPISSFKITLGWREIAAARKEGRELPTDGISQATEKVVDRFERNLVLGDTVYGFEGLTNLTGSQLITAGLTWNTAADGAHETIVRAATALNTVGATRNHALLINPLNLVRMLRRDSTSNISQRQMVEEDRLLPGGIISTPMCPVGTAVVYSKIKENAVRLTNGTIRVDQAVANNSRIANVDLYVYGVNVPKVVRPTGVCRITLPALP